MLILAAIVTGGYLTYERYFLKTEQIEESLRVTSPTPSFKSFKSSNLNLSLELPANLQVEDGSTSILISFNDSQIVAVRNGTNYESLNDYITNSKSNLNNSIENRETLVINGHQSVKGNIGKEKLYLIYVDHAVYIISTSDTSRYNDLDQIAKSFRYTP